MNNKIYFGDNLNILPGLPSGSIDLIYIDSPFNTAQNQVRYRNSTTCAETSESGGRKGFGSRRYMTTKLSTTGYEDIFDDLPAYLEPRLQEAYRLLAPHGTLYFHIDPREVHYCKVLLDKIFGRASFLNEIIWAYDYGARSRKGWPPKHDNILVYVKDPKNHAFNQNAIDRIPYMAPGLVGPEKAARGKTPTDVWWHTIVPTNGKEKTGYATQKPLGILRRIISVSSNPGDLVLDFFAGSGTTGKACAELGRRFILVENNEEAVRVMASTFPRECEIEWLGFDSSPYVFG